VRALVDERADVVNDATNKALKSITEAACAALANGISQSNVLPFWRVITPGSTIAKGLNLDAETLLELLTSDVGH
jgi:hypothetical protein